MGLRVIDGCVKGLVVIVLAFTSAVVILHRFLPKLMTSLMTGTVESNKCGGGCSGM